MAKVKKRIKELKKQVESYKFQLENLDKKSTTEINNKTLSGELENKAESYSSNIITETLLNKHRNESHPDLLNFSSSRAKEILNKVEKMQQINHINKHLIIKSNKIKNLVKELVMLVN